MVSLSRVREEWPQMPGNARKRRYRRARANGPRRHVDTKQGGRQDFNLRRHKSQPSSTLALPVTTLTPGRCLGEASTGSIEKASAWLTQSQGRQRCGRGGMMFGPRI